LKYVHADAGVTAIAVAISKDGGAVDCAGASRGDNVTKITSSDAATVAKPRKLARLRISAPPFVNRERTMGCAVFCT
jgi:hypothetical protein